MKFIKGIIILTVLLSFSNCCDPDLTGSYKLNDFSKSLVPFDDFTELNYKNELGQRRLAKTQPRKFKIRKNSPGPESCQYSEYETLNNFIQFQNPKFSIQLDLTSIDDNEGFVLRYVEIGNNSATEGFFLEGVINPFDNNLAEVTKDTILYSFEFEEVLVFSDDDNNVIKTILYSSQGRGIEFIEFVDGTYLMLE